MDFGLTFHLRPPQEVPVASQPLFCSFGIGAILGSSQSRLEPSRDLGQGLRVIALPTGEFTAELVMGRLRLRLSVMAGRARRREPYCH